MTFRITGIDPAPWWHLTQLSDDELPAHNARRMIANSKPGFPCRMTLEDAEPGESLLLVGHRIERPGSPYQFEYAIFLREQADAAAIYDDRVPPVIETRRVAMRGFDESGLVAQVELAEPGDGEQVIRAMLEDSTIAYIDVHNVIAGCFAARVERN